MADTIIQVENLGKQYRIKHQQTERYVALRDVITNGVKSIGHNLFSSRKAKHSSFQPYEEFWALKDVSFEVKQGDRIGIIGRNGAGKSTLLKILSRITEPTTGEVRIKGRVASLLEVGTGFHPELTGRENIFLNGAILGMRKTEIQRKFDEIVAFAEVEKFLDTPVKRYSSGMYVRLAFAVAAHLEPEILIVDEVLAVGDAPFQKKCIHKMEEVAIKEHRTILFVSHNTSAVQKLTNKAIYLQGGKLVSIGKTENIIQKYCNSVLSVSPSISYNLQSAPRPYKDLCRAIELLALELENVSANQVPADQDLHLKITVVVNQIINNFRIAVIISRTTGGAVGTCFSSEISATIKDEVVTFQMILPSIRLAPNIYYFTVATVQGNYGENYLDLDIVDDALHFEVVPPEEYDWLGVAWFHGWGSIRLKEAIVTRVV